MNAEISVTTMYDFGIKIFKKGETTHMAVLMRCCMFKKNVNRFDSCHNNDGKAEGGVLDYLTTVGYSSEL